MKRSNNDLVIIECPAIHRAAVLGAVQKAIKEASLAENEITVNTRTVRGSDALTLLQVTLNINIGDAGNLLLGMAAALAALKAKLILGRRSQIIRDPDDVRQLIDVTKALPSSIKTTQNDQEK